jgi:hypothetical protein
MSQNDYWRKEYHILARPDSRLGIYMGGSGQAGSSDNQHS